MAVTDEAIEKIKQMIVSGRLGPGSRLPREADLAVELGLSRNSLREAVKALSLVRVLEVRQGDGTYVSSLEPTVLLEAIGFLVDFHTDDSALDFLAVRRILEPAATALATASMSDEEIAELAQMARAVDEDASIPEVVELDLAFHARIAQGSGNKVLCSLLDSIAMPLTRARIWRGLTQADAKQQTMAQHVAIVEAMRLRDAELASSLALTHIAGVEIWLRSAP